MADADKLSEEAKAEEKKAEKDKDDSDPSSDYAKTHTKKDLEKKKEKAAKEYKDAAEKREKAAEAYAGGGNHLFAAGEYSKAADDWGERAGLRKGEGDEEDALQKQISDLLRAADEYAAADKPEIAKEKKEKAEKIKADYDKDHPKSKLKLEK